MIRNSETCSNEYLRELASRAFQHSGHGRANTVLTLPLQEITAFYPAPPLESRNAPIWFQGHQLDETVAGVLEGMSVPKYQRIEEYWIYNAGKEIGFATEIVCDSLEGEEGKVKAREPYLR